MIQNAALINALKSLGYTFKTQSERVVIYKLSGNTKRVEIHKRDYHDPAEVRAILRRAGMLREDIEKFIVYKLSPKKYFGLSYQGAHNV